MSMSINYSTITKWILVYAAAAAPGPVDVEACASDYSVPPDCCGIFKETIQVKFCPGSNGDDDYYVYRLKNVPFCDMAYCADKRSTTNTTDGKPFRCLRRIIVQE